MQRTERHRTTSERSVDERLDRLESAVWAEVAHRQQRAMRATAAFAAVAFVLVSAVSYGAGAAQAKRTGLHVSMTAELSDGGELLSEQDR